MERKRLFFLVEKVIKIGERSKAQGLGLKEGERRGGWEAGERR